MNAETLMSMQKLSLGVNPYSTQEHPCGVYNVKKTLDHNKNPTYELVLSEDVKNNRIETPSEIFGDIMKYLKRIWNDFAINKYSTGAMFLGNAGSGKTDATNILCNMGLNNNIYVVMVVNIDADLGLIKFLNTLNNCIIVLEEFSKNFSWNIQEKMLTMFSNSNCKRLFLINDNEKSNISRFIMDRPGRIKYKREFNKLDEDVFKYYIIKHGVIEDSKFYQDMMQMYRTTTILSMDHVKHIIHEHLNYPDDTLKEILSILNVGVLQKEVTYEVVEVKVKDKDEYYKLARSGKIIKDDFDNGRTYYINIDKIETAPVEPNQPGMFNRGGGTVHGIKLNNSNVIDTNKMLTVVEIENNGIKYIFKLMKSEE